MKVCGVIAEFNPLHNGHEYFLDQAVSLSGAEYCIVALSGDFTQRGAPAFCDKHLRALMALRAGADIVIELPVKVSCASAEFFASSGVFLLDAMGVVTDMAFGCEYSGLDALSSIASVLSAEPGSYKIHLREELKNGHSFPVARSSALLSVLPDIHDLQRIMNFPNDILAIEYLKALKKLSSAITPHVIKRLGAGYHDNRIGRVNSSALAIRNAIKGSDSVLMLKSEVPEYVFDLLTENFNKTLPVFTEDFSELLRYSLLRSAFSDIPLTDYADVSESLAARIKKKLPEFKDPEAFIQVLKTKDMTYSRISRALFHIFLGMKTPEEKLDEENSYIRILGFKESASPLIGMINKSSRIPVISRLSDGPQILSEKALETFNHDLFATDLYNSVIEKKFGTKVTSDLSRKLINTDGIFASV